MLNPMLTATREYRASEIPSINGHATARAIASLYGAVPRGVDEVLRVETRFGLGFMLSLPEDQFGPNEGSFGHPGAGGSVGFADPNAKIGFGFVPNRLGTRIKLDARAETDRSDLRLAVVSQSAVTSSIATLAPFT